MYTNIDGWLVDLQTMPQATLTYLIDNASSKLQRAERSMKLLCDERRRREEESEVLYLPGFAPDDRIA